MGICSLRRRGSVLDPSSVLDRVISQSSTDDCLLYRLADYKKGGRLIEEYIRGGGHEVERLVREEFGIFMYNSGKGMQITRTEYLKWKYRHIPKDQMVVHMNTKSPYDPMKKWQDHEACWQMAFRGSLGESLLHVLIMCDTKHHTRIAKILLKCFPKLALDVVEGEEYLGTSALHLAIAYSNNDIVAILVKCGSDINQRAIGSFFLPKDQQVTNPPGPEYTDYEGLAYLGEYPLAWAACLDNETCYNRLLDNGASPNLQDNFGNMILHMVVVCNQLGMFGYALRHPRLPAQDGIVNAANLTPLTMACKLARSTIFKEMLELTCIEFWRYSNITCSAYPLNALDTIKPNGETNWNSALMIILNGTKNEHLDMLEGGIIQRLLEEKWKTFARLLTLSVVVYLRPCYCGPIEISDLDNPEIRRVLYDEFFATDGTAITRYCSEVIVLLEVLYYVFFQQLHEIMNQGLAAFIKGLSSNPPKAIFLISNLLLLTCVPCRIVYFFGKNFDLKPRVIEDELLAYAAASSWVMLLFFFGALKLTGPFVVMIYKMISGDMFTFSIIYGVLLLAFTPAFYFLFKRSAEPDPDSKFATYSSTWMALFHMTLGEYEYDDFNDNIYAGMSKFVFLVHTIMLPIMLLNMLIAMMGNTYSKVISMSEKQWVKAWAKIVIALERGVQAEKLKDYLYMYSVPLGRSSDGEENLGVMVIKSANKTKAKQRKGALSNWKRVGKVTLNALKKRGISGETLRREMWGLQSAVATPVHGPRKKGGAGSYEVKAGITSVTSLDADIWDEDDNPEYFDQDAHDGMGVLTGALDQLSFSTGTKPGEVDEEETVLVGSNRPELVSAKAASMEAEKKAESLKAQRASQEIDNPAFIDDEELLLAMGINASQDDDSDDDESIRNKNKIPKVIVQNISYLETIKIADSKGSAILPPIVDLRPKTPSVKLRRLGSARKKQAPRYGLVYTEAPQLGPEDRVECLDTDAKKGYFRGSLSSADSVDEREFRESSRRDTLPAEVKDYDSGKKSRKRGNRVSPSEDDDESAEDKSEHRAASQDKSGRLGPVSDMSAILPWDNENGDIAT